MKKVMRGCLVALAVSVWVGAPQAHHSLINHDPTPIRIKGTVVQFNQINPHSFLYVEEKLADGQMRRWAVEGPSMFQLQRQGLVNMLKPGDAIDVCGYSPKEALIWQIASADPKATSLAGRLISAEMLVMPDGKVQSWGDYGLHKCFPEGYRDHHSK